MTCIKVNTYKHVQFWNLRTWMIEHVLRHLYNNVLEEKAFFLPHIKLIVITGVGCGCGVH